MALPKTTYTLTDGNLGNLPLDKSSISGFIFYNDNIADLTSFSATTKVLKFNNLAEVEATGITSDSTNFKAEHYQLEEYFRLGGRQVWIGIFAVPVGAYDFTEIDTFMLASNGEARQLAVMANANTLASADLGLLQAFADSYFTEKKPFHILYGANTGTITLAALEDLRDLASDAPNVSVIIGQDMENYPLTYSTAESLSLPNLGAPLGALSASSVSINILWVDRFNYTNGTSMNNVGFFVNDGTTDNQFVYAVNQSETTLDAINDKGYIFWRYFPNLAGTYLSNDNNSTDITSDYNQISLVRTINESVRLVDSEVVKLLGSKILLSGGTLSNPSKLAFTQAISTGLQQLVLNSDITAFESRISFTVASKQVKIDLSITPAFSANSIAVELGYFVE
jgi:hypothetical protein